jgi:hypothetical protein
MIARCVRVSTDNLESSLTRTLTAAHPQSSSNTPRCPSVVLWPPCSGLECVRTGRQRVRRGGTTRKQPANLVVEAAGESLTTLPDHTPTVRPPPKRC